ncbi:PadR family transcriptional regulator [Spirochaeta thermophila]|uniref:Probable transcriptional regulator, PadR family n=1 Tax=Winmispira thermophila (strain ATCC 49972 / DSM 6192 / RI 19.B1) TaxID=665571 RepID=E0RQY9_WINT6|nr:PadR family transcriptional regulator [Spirochaeta thermophila]ADN01567.1 probable transcriptional regulator, PadR family [Spirochaeta thermophila DSM 6192]
MDTERIVRSFFAGFIKLHILHHASQGPIYGLAMIRELKRHGYELSPGSLYPALHGLEAEGFLSSEERLVDGRRRRYYVITEEGRRVLEMARHRIGELVREVLHGE